jgi:hypothetical protein
MMKKNSDSNNNSKNDIYITLKSERNYYQGDVISGTSMKITNSLVENIG